MVVSASSYQRIRKTIGNRDPMQRANYLIHCTLCMRTRRRVGIINRLFQDCGIALMKVPLTLGSEAVSIAAHGSKNEGGTNKIKDMSERTYIL